MRVRPDPLAFPAPAGLVLTDGLDLGHLRVPFFAHCYRFFRVGLVVGQPPE